MTLIKAVDESGVIEKLCSIIEVTAEQTIKKYNKFTIGLSGGSLINYLCIGLPKIKTDWSKWVLFFCDERIVSEDSEDSTFGQYKRNLLPKVPLNESQFIIIKQNVSVDAAAEDYKDKILAHFKDCELPRFNILLLGMGPDGHTCSLFPQHPLLEEKEKIVAAITDSPKPPPERITLTYPVINNAECCIFAICGEGKAKMIQNILKDKMDLPAARVNPTMGVLYWIVDLNAAKLL